MSNRVANCAFFLLLSSWVATVLSEVTVMRSGQVIYDRSPKLRIRGSGFDADDHDISLELGAGNASPLKVDKDYLISKDPDDDGLILKLLGNRRWVDLDDRDPPVALTLSAVRFGDSSKNLLREPVILAQVLSTPSVEEGDGDMIFQSATHELRINGTGFLGAKKVDLYFDPPLYKEIAYEDVSKYPLTRDQVVLRIRHNYQWREEEGPLRIMGVDTGGGPVRLNGDEGVYIGSVVSDLEAHDVSVEATADQQLIYHDQATIMISGAGFNPIGNTLRWANGILGNNVNYTTLSTSEDTIKLRIAPGSYWRKNFDNLPGALTLLAVNTGEGFVAVGPTNSGKGRDVAMVFERPQVFSANTKLFRTHSHELHIRGSGFPADNSGYKPLLKFSPPLKQDVDFTVSVIDRTELEVTLLDDHAWRDDAGALQLTAINTRGDEAGWVVLGGDGVHVAQVDEDVGADATGGVEIFPMGVKVYQSALNQKIQITGTGFKEGLSFVFEPDLKAGSDYDLDIESKNVINLRLRAKRKWRADAGLIVAKAVKLGGKTYNLANGEGIRVAVVLQDPVVTPSKDTYHESQSKLVVIEGSGFTNVVDTRVIIRPASPGAYKVLGVLDDAIRVQLKPDQDWLPSFMSLNGEGDKKVPMLVSSIDTGAGEITFEEPVIVGYIVKDREGVTCDDSCEFAFDGVCDDGSEPNDAYYYQNYANYMDDDLGGFYGEPEDLDGDGFAYGVAYDDYYMENEDYQVSACVEGTDCTDCGGVDAIVDWTKPLGADSGYETCVNTCIYPRDGVCDDPRGTKYCELGTDCQDCGPVGADNFTRSDDDGWWDDDDDYWSFDDGQFNEQAKGVDSNREHVKVVAKSVVVEAETAFLHLLEIMVVTVGCLFLIAALFLLHRWYQGLPIPFLSKFDPEAQERSFELAPHKKMPITPDVIRT